MSVISGVEPEKPAQLNGRINRKVFNNFKIALLKNGDKKEAVLESLIRGYIKNGTLV